MKSPTKGKPTRQIFGVSGNKTSVARVMNMISALELFSPEEIQKKMEDLIYDTLGEVPPGHMGELSQWDEIDRAYPDNTKMLVISNEICGFWAFVALKDEYFQLARQGKLREGSITIKALDSMQAPKEYKGYFLDIVVSSEHRTMKNFLLLVDAFVNQLEAYAETGSFLVEWCANAYSDAGRKLCQTFGLEYVCDHEQEGEGKIYYAKLSNESLKLPIFKKYPRLVELYSNYFAEQNRH